MVKLSQRACSIWAKKAKDNSLYWLPLVMHMEDCAAVAGKLWQSWLSDGAKNTIILGLSSIMLGNFSDVESLAKAFFIFLAIVHDIGKITPSFQAKNCCGNIQNDLDMRISERLRVAGLHIEDISYFHYANKTPHALASQVLLERAGYPRNISVIAGGHHGKPPEYSQVNNNNYDNYAENYNVKKDHEAQWDAVREELMEYALELAGFKSYKELPLPDMSAQALLTGLVIMTDWIASDERYFPLIGIDVTPQLYNKERNGRNSEAWESFNPTRAWMARNDWMDIDSLYKNRFSFTPNYVQSFVAQAAGSVGQPGILVLEAPMGIGKTEAALSAAEAFAQKQGQSGIFFALPTQATSDGIFPRVINWINNLDAEETHSIVLAHGKAQFNQEFKDIPSNSANLYDEEDEVGVVVHDWFKGKKRSLLADFVVGTIDQVLLAALKQKHLALRHLGLANKVVIIDEVHAYDAYMGQYLYRALRWLGAYQVPVIVLSATLPSRRRREIVDAYLGKSQRMHDVAGEWAKTSNYPLITYSDGKEVKQRSITMNDAKKRVKFEPIAENEMMGRLTELLSEGGCAGIIVNTVKRAQMLAKELGKEFGEEDVLLTHSRFLSPDRAEKERQLLDKLGKRGSRPHKLIVVGTQVLEQSLDIDFDIMITDLCPMDLLLQRIGRMHRHERRRPEKLVDPVCMIIDFNADGFEEGASAIYGDYLLMRTKALLPQSILLPDDIPHLVQRTYDEDDSLTESLNKKAYEKAKLEHEKLIKTKESRARKFRIGLPDVNCAATLVNWITDIGNLSEEKGNAAVRDSADSIEVLMIQQSGDSMHLLPWIKDYGGLKLSVNETPPDELAKEIACCSVRLPGALCAAQNIDKTISELENIAIKKGFLFSWYRSYWLRGALFLILDENFKTELCGYRLYYDKIYGLCHEKGDENA